MFADENRKDVYKIGSHLKVMTKNSGYQHAIYIGNN